MTVASELSPFLTWFSEWGQVVFFFAQILFWIAIAAAAVEVAMAYRRYVDHKTGAAQAKAEKKAADAAAKNAVVTAAVSAQSSTPIEIDKFVE